MIEIRNAGPEIIGTNFFESPWAARGWYYLSSNAGCFRLLVPDPQVRAVDDILTWFDARSLRILIEEGKK